MEREKRLATDPERRADVEPVRQEADAVGKLTLQLATRLDESRDAQGGGAVADLVPGRRTLAENASAAEPAEPEGKDIERASDGGAVATGQAAAAPAASTAAAPAPPATPPGTLAPAVRHATVDVADGAGDDRTTVGLAERVELTSAVAGTWRASAAKTGTPLTGSGRPPQREETRPAEVARAHR